MERDAIWEHIDSERAWLADLLESLPERHWAHPSLCQEWSVRDVGAHLTFAQARVRDVLWPALRTGMRYNAMINYAARHSPLSHQEIVTTLRSFIGSRRRAPLVTDLEPLLDILVHAQDICVPLGIEHTMPTDAAVAAADRVLSLKGPMRLWKQPSDIQLIATDTDWTFGDGTAVRAPIQAHLLYLTGRPRAASEDVVGA
jgi:uncharacterized protein (TIGR03083 family)